MECPTCRLTNPIDALTCDCGYDFTTKTPSATPGWKIDLNWGQKLKAYWSVFWPAWTGSALFVLVLDILLGEHSSLLIEHLSSAFLISKLTFLLLQATLTRRLITKNFETFRVYVVRGDGQQTRDLSKRELFDVWLRIVWPQVVFWLLAEATLIWLRTTPLPPETVRPLSTMATWILVLVVGPNAVAYSMRVHYPTFRLQAYGFRY